MTRSDCVRIFLCACVFLTTVLKVIKQQESRFPLCSLWIVYFNEEPAKTVRALRSLWFVHLKWKWNDEWLPLTLKSLPTSTYEITRIYINNWSMHSRFILYGCVCTHRVYMYVRVECVYASIYRWMRASSLYVYASFSQVVLYVFFTKIICIGLDFILVFTCISYVFWTSNSRHVFASNL